MSEASPDSRFRFTTIAHRTHRFLGPLGEERAAWFLEEFERAGVRRGGNALDIGCGKAELVLRAAARFDLAATGVDPNGAFLEEATKRAAELGVQRWTPIHATFAASGLPASEFDLCLSIGASEAFGNPRAATGGQRAAMATLGRLVRRGGLVLFGGEFWQGPIPPELLALSGGAQSDAPPDPRELLAVAEEVGLAHLGSWLSSLAEWDAYEDRYEASMREFLDAHPDDPDAAAFLERITFWSTLRRHHVRSAIGFRWHLFRRDL